MRFIVFARSVLQRASRNQATILAAGVSFYFFLSLIPALFAAVSVFGLFLKPRALESLSEQLTRALPADAASLIQGQLEQLEASSTPSLGFGAAIAIAVSIWSASGGISNLLKAINFMYETRVQRSYVAGRAVALGLTLGAGLLLVILAGALSAPHWLPFVIGDSRIESIAVDLLRWTILLLSLTAAMTVVFYLAPGRAKKGRAFWIGVAFATIGWVLTTAGFSFYTSTFGKFQASYGALAGVIVLLLWLWIGMWTILVGACVHAEFDELEHQAH